MVTPKVTHPCPTCHKRVILASLPECPVCARWKATPGYIESGYQTPHLANVERGACTACTRCGVPYRAQRRHVGLCPVCRYETQCERDLERQRRLRVPPAGREV